MRNIKSNLKLLNLVYFITFFANALFYSFLQVYLISKGLKEDSVGLLMSFTPLLCLIINPLISYYASSAKRLKNIFLIFAILETLIFLIINGVNSFSFALVSMILVSLIDPPLFVIMDSYASLFTNENNYNYSLVRTYGSLAYAIGALLAGVILNIGGYEVLFCLASLIMLISSILIFFLKRTNSYQKQKKIELFSLFKNKKFLFISLFFVIVLAFASLVDTYISIYLMDVKKFLTSVEYGILSSLWVVIEVVTIYLLNKFKVAKYKLLMIIMALVYLLRVVSIAINIDIIVVIFALLRGIGMGINIYLYIPLLNKLLPSSKISDSLLLGSIFKGVIQTILIFLSGYVIVALGYSLAFMIFSLIFIFILIIFYILYIRYQKRS